MNRLIKIKLIILSLSLLLPVSAFSSINLEKYNQFPGVSAIAADPEVSAALKNTLGKDYEVFNGNFDLFGEPHKTPGRGMFVEGWLEHLYLENASAFVIYPTGEVYAAWVTPDTKFIYYKTNDGNSQGINPEIVTWAKRFEDKRFKPLAMETTFTGLWAGEKNSDSTLTLSLVQKNNSLSGSYCFISHQGKRIDCPADGQANLNGKVDNNRAVISFHSAFNGVNGRAELEMNDEQLTWHLINPPGKGDYYAPESYLLKRSTQHTSSSRKLATDKFTILLANKCGQFTSPCNQVSYSGIRNSDSQIITLQGATVNNAAGSVTGATFSNGNVTYQVNYDPVRLVVRQGNRILVDQLGHWLN